MELVDEVEEDDILVNLIKKYINGFALVKYGLIQRENVFRLMEGLSFMKKTYFIGMAKIKKKLLLVMELYSGV